MGMNSVARPHSAPFEKRSGRDVGLRPHTAGPTAPHSRGHPIRSHTRGVSRPGSPWRAQRAQLKAIMQNYEANVRALEDGRGKSAASDELRSRIKESVLRSSEALSPSNRSRLNRRQAYAKTLGSREPEKLTTGIRPQPDDDEKGGHPDSCSDDVRGKSESDEQEFSEDEDGGDDTDRLEVLQAQRHLLTREGLPPGICQLDGRIEKLRARIRTDREEKEETLLQRKLAGLRSNHQMREFAAIKECTEDRVLLQKQMDQEMEDMVATQESEVFELMEEASKRAANQVAACKCTKEYLCQHNRRAFIQTRKRTKEVLKCHDNAKRLRRCRQFQEAKKWEKMARDLDKKHDLEWRKMVITSVTKNEWGAGNGSKVELLMRKHCLQRQALQQAHRNRASLLDRACEFKLKTLRSALGAEEFKLKRRAHFAQKQRILDARDMLTARRRHAKLLESRMQDGIEVSKNMFKDKPIEGDADIDWKPPAFSGLINSESIFDSSGRPRASSHGSLCKQDSREVVAVPIQARKTSGLRGVPSATETTAEINHLHSRWDKPGSQLYSNPTMAFVPDPSYALGNSGYGYGYGAVMNSTSYSPTPPTKRRSSNKSNARRRRSSCSLSHRKRSSGSNRSFADEVQQPNVTQSMTPLTSPIEIPLSLSSFRLGATDKVTKVLDDAAPGVTALLMSGRDEQNRQRRGKEDTSWRPGQMYDGAGNICGERCGKRQVESDFDGKIGGRYQQPTRVELEGHSDLYRLARQTTVDVKEKCHVGGGGSNTPGTTIATSFAEIATSKVALPASTKNEGGEPQLGSTLSMRENQTLPAQQHPLMGVGVSNINESDVSSTIGSGHIFRPQPHPSIDHPSGCTQPRCTKRGEAKGDTPGPSAVNVRTQQNEKMESRQTAMLRHGATKEEVKVDGSDYSYSTDSCSAGDGPPNARDSTPISKHAEGGFSTRNEDVTNALHGGRREEESVQQIHGGIAEQENTSGRCETNHAGDGKRTGKDDSALEELGWKLVLSLPPSFEPEPREESSPLDREDTPLRQPVFMCGPDSGGGRPRIPEGRPRLGDVGLEDVGHNAVHTLTQVLGGEDESRATTREAQAADNLNLSPPWFLSPTSSDRTPPWCTSESRSTDVAARNNEQQSSGSSPPWGFTPTAGIVAPELPPLLNCRTAAPEHLQMDKTLSST